MGYSITVESGVNLEAMNGVIVVKLPFVPTEVISTDPPRRALGNSPITVVVLNGYWEQEVGYALEWDRRPRLSEIRQAGLACRNLGSWVEWVKAKYDWEEIAVEPLRSWDHPFEE